MRIRPNFHSKDVNISKVSLQQRAREQGHDRAGRRANRAQVRALIKLELAGLLWIWPIGPD